VIQGRVLVLRQLCIRPRIPLSCCRKLAWLATVTAYIPVEMAKRHGSWPRPAKLAQAFCIDSMPFRSVKSMHDHSDFSARCLKYGGWVMDSIVTILSLDTFQSETCIFMFNVK
jgi:hypothetical protein